MRPYMRTHYVIWTQTSWTFFFWWQRNYVLWCIWTRYL